MDWTSPQWGRWVQTSRGERWVSMSTDCVCRRVQDILREARQRHA